MSNIMDNNLIGFIVKFVDDPIITHANSVETIGASELEGLARTGLS